LHTDQAERPFDRVELVRIQDRFDLAHRVELTGCAARVDGRIAPAESSPDPRRTA